MTKRKRLLLINPFILISIFWVFTTVNSFAQPIASNDIGFQGLRLIDQGQFEQGMQLVNQAVDADPSNASWRLNIANLLYTQGLKQLKQGSVERANTIWSFAEMHLEEAMHLFDSDHDKILLSEAYYVMGEIYQYGHVDLTKSAHFYQKALDLYAHPRAQRAMEALQPK